MRIVIGVLALSAAACGDDGMLPIGGGSDGGGQFPDGSLIDSSGTGIDGALADGSVAPIDAAEFMGRVCVAEDPRKLNVCSDTLAGGLTVRIGMTSTTTATNGAFTIAYAGGTLWRVTGSSIVTSHMLLGDFKIPAILRSTYNTMNTENLNNLPPNPGEGAVMIRVINDGAHVAGATGSSTPTGQWLAFYDNPSSPTTYLRAETGPDGAIWLPAIDVGTANVSVVSGTETVQFNALPINDGAITFTTAIFPP